MPNLHHFRNFLAKISKNRFSYEPLITVEISKSRLLHNLEAFQTEFKKLSPDNMVAPVLKSNAYGHGLYEVADILEKDSKYTDPSRSSRSSMPIPFFVIDSHFEAMALRSKGIRTPFLIIGYTRLETIMSTHIKDVAFTMTSLDALRDLCELFQFQTEPRQSSQLPQLSEKTESDKNKRVRPSQKNIHIHLKIDTGMHRQGILPHEIDEAIEMLRKTNGQKKSAPHIILDGICSHLPDADNADHTFTKNQIALWNNIVKKFRSHFPSIKYIHLSNTDGNRFSGEIDANVARLGIGLYGLGSAPLVPILPIMEMRTILTGIKKIKKGETVGYGKTFTAPKDMTIATIPVGYFEGVDSRLSNKGSLLVGSGDGTSRQFIPCQIVGRVSMNITVIDVSAILEPKLDMPVIVFSKNPRDPNSIQSIARACDTMPYEIVVHIPAHLRRVVVE